MTTSTSSPPPTKPVGPDAVPTPASGAPVEAPASPKRRRGARAGWWLVAFVVACGWDRAVWLMVTRAGRPTLQWLEDSLAWETLLVLLRGALRMRGQAIGEAAAAIGYGALYLYGRMWPWIALALVFIFRHWAGTDGARVKAGLRRGVFVVLVPGAAGLAAEAMKLLTRRMRPEAMDGYYQFRPWPGSGVLSERFWNASGLGLASSHAAVAFGGALAAGVLWPRRRWVLWGSAVLCALGRVAVGAHYLSDVVAGAALAFGAFHLFYAWDRRNNRGVPIGA